MLEWTCPKCGTVVELSNQMALLLIERAGACQGCRARKTLEHKPELLQTFLEYWNRAGYPESDSWLLAIA